MLFRTLMGRNASSTRLDLGVEVEECFETRLELFFDVFFASLEDVHGHMGFAAIFQFYGSLAHFSNFLRRQQAHTVHQR